MGASCCRLRRADHDNDRDRYNRTWCTSRYLFSFQLQTTRRRAALAAHGGRNQVLSSTQDIMYIPRTRGGRLTRHLKIDRVRPQEPQFTAVTGGGSAIGVDSYQVLKSNGEKNPSADCKLESSDVCEESRTSDSLLPITDDDDFCPTCLEGYDKDNPKIITHCKHHYHLSCILEWMERRDTCPICDQAMIFNETS